MKKLFVSISAVLASGIIASAAKPVFSGALDLTSKYMWRGTECSSGATLFPSASLEIGGLSLSAWGAYALDSSVSEIDLSIGYTLGTGSVNSENSGQNTKENTKYILTLDRDRPCDIVR